MKLSSNFKQPLLNPFQKHRRAYLCTTVHRETIYHETITHRHDFRRPFYFTLVSRTRKKDWLFTWFILNENKVNIPFMRPHLNKIVCFVLFAALILLYVFVSRLPGQDRTSYLDAASAVGRDRLWNSEIPANFILSWQRGSRADNNKPLEQ